MGSGVAGASVFGAFVGFGGDGVFGALVCFGAWVLGGEGVFGGEGVLGAFVRFARALHCRCTRTTARIERVRIIAFF